MYLPVKSIPGDYFVIPPGLFGTRTMPEFDPDVIFMAEKNKSELGDKGTVSSSAWAWTVVTCPFLLRVCILLCNSFMHARLSELREASRANRANVSTNLICRIIERDPTVNLSVSHCNYIYHKSWWLTGNLKYKASRTNGSLRATQPTLIDYIFNSRSVRCFRWTMNVCCFRA